MSAALPVGLGAAGAASLLLSGGTLLQARDLVGATVILCGLAL